MAKKISKIKTTVYTKKSGKTTGQMIKNIRNYTKRLKKMGGK